MDSRALIIASCWFAIALISSVYIWVALGGGHLGDVLFGLFVPVGLLILVGIAVTFGISSTMGVEAEDGLNPALAKELEKIMSKLDSLKTKVDHIEKIMEE